MKGVPERMNPAANLPIFFMPNRVRRRYAGGLLLDQLAGIAQPHDADCPEDWLASTTRALNGERSQGADEGLARVRNQDGTPGALLADLIARDPHAYLGLPDRPLKKSPPTNPAADSPGLSILCKYLDPAVRLPIQCHPDRAFARTHYNSEHGKAEAWVILGTREIAGEEQEESEPPYIMIGFKPGVTAAAFARTVHDQNIPAMLAMLHKIPVRVGEVFFIHGRCPHAIGPGVFMLEVQEPSDWVVKTERTCGDMTLSDREMFGNLSPETALACFDYNGQEISAILDRVRMRPRLFNPTTGGDENTPGLHESLIANDTTECFALDRLTIIGKSVYSCTVDYQLACVATGTGTVNVGEASFALTRGRVFLVPHGVRTLTFTATTPLIIYFALPGTRKD